MRALLDTKKHLLFLLLFGCQSTKNAPDKAATNPIQPENPAQQALDKSKSSGWGKDPQSVPDITDFSALKSKPAILGSDDEPWAINLTALRWTDPQTQNSWFLSYKAKLSNDSRLENVRNFNAKHNLSAVDSDISAESFCKNRNGEIPTLAELSQALANGLQQEIEKSGRQIFYGDGSSDGLWTKTPSSPEVRPFKQCHDDFLMTYSVKNRFWGCAESSGNTGVGEHTALTCNAACIVRAK
jgi:hypothetical protein